MKKSIVCTNVDCPQTRDPSQANIVKYGYFARKCDGKRVQRFKCTMCGHTVSNQTFNTTYRQHKPRLNSPVKKLLCSKVSMRQTARLLGTNYKTVARKMQHQAEVARASHRTLLEKTKDLHHLQMDEMETFEHTKCKPLSIALAVDPKTRVILAAKVAIMPAKGTLAKISRRRYGPRIDQRKEMFENSLALIKPCCSETVTILTDKKAAYRSWIKNIMPSSNHKTTKGRRGCVVGYGELKEGGFDPLFMLNHTAAMIRDGLARMLRRTWCTTKKNQRLQDALDLYVWSHNQRMLAIANN